MATARELVTDALQTSGIVALSSTPSAIEISNGLKQLNRLIEDWDTMKLWPYSNLETTGTLTTSDGEYTIGSGGDIAIARPNRLIAFQVIDSGLVYPLRFVSSEEFDNSGRFSTLSGKPEVYTFRSDYPLAKVEIYPVPDKAYSFNMVSSVKISNYALDDTVALPSGYYGALEYGLASILGDIYGVNVDKVQRTANNRLTRIKRMNEKSRELSFNQISSGSGHYDINSDGYV